jgi:hypothetical protein
MLIDHTIMLVSVNDSHNSHIGSDDAQTKLSRLTKGNVLRILMHSQKETDLGI